MKATSHPLPSVQHPPTIFGMPPKAMLAAATAAFMLYFVLTATGAPATVSIVALLAALPSGFALAWRARRRDPHCETVYGARRAFWPKRPRHRILLAGAAPPGARRR